MKPDIETDTTAPPAVELDLDAKRAAALANLGAKLDRLKARQVELSDVQAHLDETAAAAAELARAVDPDDAAIKANARERAAGDAELAIRSAAVQHAEGAV